MLGDVNDLLKVTAKDRRDYQAAKARTRGTRETTRAVVPVYRSDASAARASAARASAARRNIRAGTPTAADFALLSNVVMTTVRGAQPIGSLADYENAPLAQKNSFGSKLKEAFQRMREDGKKVSKKLERAMNRVLSAMPIAFQMELKFSTQKGIRGLVAGGASFAFGNHAKKFNSTPGVPAITNDGGVPSASAPTHYLPQQSEAFPSGTRSGLLPGREASARTGATGRLPTAAGSGLLPRGASVRTSPELRR